MGREAGRRLHIKIARAFLPLVSEQASEAYYLGAHGGRAGAKSHFFGELLLLRCVRNPNTRAVCIREVQKSLEHSVKQLLEDKIAALGLGDYFDIQHDRILVLYQGREYGHIIFQGMQNHTANSIKSLEGYDVAWVEEAQTLSQRSLELLLPTIRKDGSQVWFSWNPVNASDPVDKFLREEMKGDPKAVVVAVSYKDNPWLSDKARAEAARDRARDLDKYAHVWLGQYRKISGARVFTNWRIGKPEEFKERRLLRSLLYGADFGFAVDPSVIVETYIEGRTLYVSAEAYAVGIATDFTPFLFAGCDDEHVNTLNAVALEALPFEFKREFRGIPNCHKWPITADSANPQLIDYMQRHGFSSMKPAIKGPGSVEEGVSFVKTFDIVVHPDCINTIDELINYSFKIDPKTELVLPVLQDKKNHVIDALRYAVEDERHAKVEVW